MKKLIVFYSFDGNTKLIAENIADEIGADLLELKPVKEITRNNFMKIFAGGKQAMTKAEPELLPFSIKPEDYDLILIGSLNSIFPIIVFPVTAPSNFSKKFRGPPP